MAKEFDFGSVSLHVGDDDANARPRDEVPFRILVLGDFSGHANRGVAQSNSEPHPIAVDRDNCDDVLARLAPELTFSLEADGPIHLKFSELEDFHPDRLFERVAPFASMRELRRKLSDSATFHEGARELGYELEDRSSIRGSNPRERGAAAPSAKQIPSGSLLDQMIEQTESQSRERSSTRPADPVRDFAQHVAEKYSQIAADARQPEILAMLDRAIGGLMRRILHNPDFQALEAIWRGTCFLVHRLETNSQLKVYVLDISKDDLATELNSAADLRQTGIYRVLVESAVETPGADPWALVVGCYNIDEQLENAVFLTRMAQLAHRARAPFIAEANPRLLGCTEMKSASPHSGWSSEANWWPELRRLPEAESLGLAIPRFLLRLPYGRDTSALESIEFEEFPEAAAHEDYLWANPAFAVALLLGQSFTESGWRMLPGMLTEIGHLPLHIARISGEARAKPCAEVLLTEQTVAAIEERGCIPLVSFKNRDAVRIARFQSIAGATRGLAGRWGR